MKPIYQPKGRAGEYCEWAINIYTGCNHGCTYCYARQMAHRWGKDFSIVEPRKDIVNAVKQQIHREKIKDREIQLCFTCDPYPADVDTSVTREIIGIIKNSNNRVRILTKGGNRALRDFDLLDSEDWFGVTLSGHALNMKENEPNAAPYSERMFTIAIAANRGIKTWASFEPVFDTRTVYDAISGIDYIDMYKIGKLNYASSVIDWSEFGRECKRLCIEHERNYYIKEDLRREMEDSHG